MDEGAGRGGCGDEGRARHGGAGGHCDGARAGDALWAAADDVVAVGGADGGARAALAGRVAALVVVLCADVALEELGNGVNGCGVVVGCRELLNLCDCWFEGSEVIRRGESQRREEERRKDGAHGGREVWTTWVRNVENRGMEFS